MFSDPIFSRFQLHAAGAQRRIRKILGTVSAMPQFLRFLRIPNSRARARGLAWVVTSALALVLPVRAAQVDIPGPVGSVAFGTWVTALPNGNFVVTDPQFANGPVPAIGAVYLYSPSRTLISTLTGSSANDRVGSGWVVVVGGGNFLVLSREWNNSGASGAGAVTWVNGSTGLSGVVSASNSLVGTTVNDFVLTTATVLSNGNYVVDSPAWNNGVANSLVGAATWGDGSSGTVGPVSASNSLVGTTANDYVGYLTGVRALSNGNYVVASPLWNNGVANSHVGAVTWGNGSSGITGAVSTSNSLVGTTTGDSVGNSYVTPLSNGNYVVGSSVWNNGVANSHVGAATWCNGSSAFVGSVSASNSLIGTAIGDYVSDSGVTALTNGNYVVASLAWSNGAANNVGAATWGDGSGGTIGPVSAINSLIGTTTGDLVSSDGVTALSNGDYVVASSYWNHRAANNVGAATWGNGSSGTTGPVSTSNSLVGTTAGDKVGSYRVAALSNGNYVVASPNWNNGVANSHVGAATWGNGNGGITGPVSTSNSLVGTTTGDSVGSSYVTALSNGNYVVGSPGWNNGVANSHVGAATWGNGGSGFVGSVSASNSLIGTTPGDNVANRGVFALSDGNYVVLSGQWNNHGAVTLASGAFRLKTTIQSSNSVLGTTEGDGASMRYAYDPARQTLIVGRPADNIVSMFTMDQIFAGDFEP
jgi:hypothetical protein